MSSMEIGSNKPAFVKKKRLLEAYTLPSLSLILATYGSQEYIASSHEEPARIQSKKTKHACSHPSMFYR